MGVSLGINLLPLHAKCCSFNCIYCECGWTTSSEITGNKLPAASEVESALESRLKQMASEEQLPDAITFAGNGEPTLHPAFGSIIRTTIRLRDLYAPRALISVLSNGTMLHKPEVFDALLLVDLNIQKLDAGTQDTILRINQPNHHFSLESLLQHLERFQGKVIIQTLFLQGTVQGMPIDNTTDAEISAWIGHLKRIKPRYVMIYPVERATPELGIGKPGPGVLNAIAARVEKEGIEVKVY